MDGHTVILAEPDADGAACVALVARAGGEPDEIFFLPSTDLLEFLAPSTQRSLPRVYSLIICGLGLVHTSWDGELLRPHVVQALRDFTCPVRWFSHHTWQPDDRVAMANIIGENRLVVSPSAQSCAELVAQHYDPPDPSYTAALLQLVGGPGDSPPDWVPKWQRVISSMKDNPSRIRRTIPPLIQGEPERLAQQLLDQAEQVERRNRELAAEKAGDPLPMRDHTLAGIDIPPDLHPYWREISGYVRSARGVDFTLCRLVDRPVLVLSRSAELRVDLRRWARYVTDVVPAATAVEAQPEAVPFFVEGLSSDPGLVRDVVRALKDGAHLLDK